MTSWNLARASGISAYLLISLATIAGLSLSSRYLGKKASRNLTIGHEALSIAGILLLIVHAWAILNDAFFEFTTASILVPGLSPYDPVGVGLGIVAGYITLIASVSFYLRKRIGARAWRRIHYSTPVAYAAMTAHGVMAGSDTSHPMMIAMYSASLGTVTMMIGYRIASGVREAKRKAARTSSRSVDKPHAHAAVQ